jgi:pimeloyl-ACP methyl ester carboxylesterase
MVIRPIAHSIRLDDPEDAMTEDKEPVSCAIPVGSHTILGDMTFPLDARGCVIFAHGSGSSRQSPRNRQVARTLNRAGLATLLIDLLTVEEELIDNQTSELRFNIELLAHRLVGVTDWLAGRTTFPPLPLGYFGASTGAAAALVAATKRPRIVKAIVCRGGRPDLADAALQGVIAPTLLIVGEFDQEVLDLNRRAAKAIPGETVLVIVPAATHLFEEPGALEQVALLASDWFARQLIGKQAA